MKNFILDLEFKTDVNTNSGVVIYCTDKGNGSHLPLRFK